eukprot:1702806-Amphidinium_carterae.1
MCKPFYAISTAWVTRQARRAFKSTLSTLNNWRAGLLCLARRTRLSSYSQNLAFDSRYLQGP